MRDARRDAGRDARRPCGGDGTSETVVWLKAASRAANGPILPQERLRRQSDRIVLPCGHTYTRAFILATIDDARMCVEADRDAGVDAAPSHNLAHQSALPGSRSKVVKSGSVGLESIKEGVPGMQPRPPASRPSRRPCSPRAWILTRSMWRDGRIATSLVVGAAISIPAACSLGLMISIVAMLAA